MRLTFFQKRNFVSVVVIILWAGDITEQCCCSIVHSSKPYPNPILKCVIVWASCLVRRPWRNSPSPHGTARDNPVCACDVSWRALGYMQSLNWVFSRKVSVCCSLFKMLVDWECLGFIQYVLNTWGVYAKWGKLCFVMSDVLVCVSLVCPVIRTL